MFIITIILESIISLQARSFEDVRRLEGGLRSGIQSPTLKAQGKNSKIKRLWESLPPRGELSLDNFAKHVSYIIISPLIEHLFVKLEVSEINEGKFNIKLFN